MAALFMEDATAGVAALETSQQEPPWQARAPRGSAGMIADGRGLRSASQTSVAGGGGGRVVGSAAVVGDENAEG